jgi:GH35 family endo-1,4-beta-xylanase
VVKYEEIFRRHFNAAVHANSLKWHEMERAKGHVDARTPMRVFDWCEENEITMRGHCIFWGFNGALPAWVRSAPKNELEPLLKERASSVLALFKGRISEFDAINEPLMFAQMAQAMNWQDCAPYFRICREASPDATLYFNEGGLVTPGETQRCLELVKNLLAQEAPLGGIGLKAHCIGRIPDPATLWSALDRFGAFKLPVKIVELSFRNTEDAEQAEGIERLYRAFFAHPAVSGIYLWGFWEGAADLPSCWLWRRDWSPRPSAERLSKLLTEEWTTKGEANVGADGLLRFRGFYGEYRISVGNQEYRAILLPEKLSAKCFPAPPPRKPASADKPPTAPGDF